MYRLWGRNQTVDGACDIGKGVSLEFALFTTVFVCAIGVAAFLALTLTVEADRRVSEPAPQHLPYLLHCLVHRQWSGLPRVMEEGAG